MLPWLHARPVGSQKRFSEQAVPSSRTASSYAPDARHDVLSPKRSRSSTSSQVFDGCFIHGRNPIGIWPELECTPRSCRPGHPGTRPIECASVAHVLRTTRPWRRKLKFRSSKFKRRPLPSVGARRPGFSPADAIPLPPETSLPLVSPQGTREIASTHTQAAQRLRDSQSCL